MPGMAQNTNGTKASKKQPAKGQSRAAVKRGEEIQRYNRHLQENEARLVSKTNVRGEALTSEQVSTLREVIEKQRARLGELMGG